MRFVSVLASLPFGDEHKHHLFFSYGPLIHIKLNPRLFLKLAIFIILDMSLDTHTHTHTHDLPITIQSQPQIQIILSHGRFSLGGDAILYQLRPQSFHPIPSNRCFLFIFLISDHKQSRQRKGQLAVCQREKRGGRKGEEEGTRDWANERGRRGRVEKRSG